jgi:hypothetical protein
MASMSLVGTERRAARNTLAPLRAYRFFIPSQQRENGGSTI